MPEPGRENGKYGRFLSQALLEAALSELALAQHAVFGLDQLGELGLTAAAVHKRATAGRLHRIHHTVYSLVPKALLKREGLYMAAVLACGPGAVLSYRSGAVLHQLRDWGHTRIEVTVPVRSHRAHSGVLVHRSTTLTEADAHLAGESLRRLTSLLESGKSELRLHIKNDERPDEDLMTASSVARPVAVMGFQNRSIIGSSNARLTAVTCSAMSA